MLLDDGWCRRRFILSVIWKGICMRTLLLKFERSNMLKQFHGLKVCTRFKQNNFVRALWNNNFTTIASKSNCLELQEVLIMSTSNNYRELFCSINSANRFLLFQTVFSCFVFNMKFLQMNWGSVIIINAQLNAD